MTSVSFFVLVTFLEFIARMGRKLRVCGYPADKTIFLFAMMPPLLN